MSWSPTTTRGRWCGAAGAPAARCGRAAFVAALELGADLVFEMDADWSHHPRHLPAMIAALDGADVVLGSRRVPGGADIGRTAFRRWLTGASNLYVRLLLGVPVKDCNSGYRGWRASALRAVDVDRAFSPGPAIVHELLFKARLRGQRIVEVPIRFQDRERGQSTLTFRTLMRSYVTILRLRWMALRGTLFAAGALLLAALLAAGCGPDGPAPAGDGPGAGPPAERPNVLVMTLDTVRADRLGCYGHTGRDLTPHLDALARESIVFDEAFAVSSFTPPTHAAILTSLYPAEHGLLYWNKHLADVPTAADAFGAAGWRTVAVTPLPTLLKIGLDRGFGQAVSPEHSMDGRQVVLGDADAVNALALPRLLDAGDARPFFAWVHYYDAHRPYGRQGEQWAFRYVEDPARRRPEVGASEPWYQLTPEKRAALSVGEAETRLIEDRYDGGLAFLDDRLGALLDALREAGVLDRTILVVVADHGEVFTEHEPEWFAHDPYLQDENVHVPLLVRLPGGRHAGTRVPDLVSQVDILPTLFELAGVAPLAGQRLSGSSLVPALEGRPLRRAAVFGERQGSDLSEKKRDPPPPAAEVAASRDRVAMVRTATRKLLLATDRNTAELLDVTGRPPESADLKAAEPEALDGLLRGYHQWWSGLHLPGESNAAALDPATEEFLRSLGYTGGHAAGGDGPR